MSASIRRTRDPKVRGRRRLALERLAAGHGDDARVLAAARKDERRAQRAERLAEVVRNRFGQHRHSIAANCGDEAQQRQFQSPRDILRRLHRVVEILDPERQAERHDDAGHDRREPLLPRVRRERELRDLGAIDDGDVVFLAVRDNAQLFFLRQ
jgi:hypothetical protein